MMLEEFDIFLFNSEAMLKYEAWPTPTIIICDGPYGVRGFKGDLVSEFGLAEWYEPHIIEWSKKYSVLYIDKTYSNCSYHFKDRGAKTVEVLITNYKWEEPKCEQMTLML